MTRSLLAAWLVLAIFPAAAMADSQPVRLCKSYVQGRIDVLDAELHKGEKPDVARKLFKRRDLLKAQLQRCTKNPNAYKKEF